MSRTETVDDVIVGGGAAGLSLAGAMLRAGGSERQTLILEPRKDYVRDRTWCYWGAQDSRHDGLVTHRWRKWRVRAGARDTTVESNSFEYCHIPADAFYARALLEIDQANSIELRKETNVSNVCDLGDHAIIHTNRGQIVANRVFDSRPLPAQPGVNDKHVDLKQHFMGWHVRTKKPVFDPEVVTLMDFITRDDDLIEFFYVLPFAEDEALLEVTFISKNTLAEEAYEHELTTYLSRATCSTGYEVIWRERGCIPMTTRPLRARRSASVYAIGGAGGLIKPSTGYAFLAIQRFSDAMAARLADGGLSQPPRVRSPLMSALDRIFLAVIEQRPDRAPEVFAQLFQRVEPDALVRFLTDRPQPADVLAVMMAMPKWLFARRAMIAAPIWLNP